MKRFLFVLCMVCLLAIPVRAAELTAPEVPDSGASLMPEETGSFWDGVREILADALPNIRPDLAEASRTCIGVAAMALLTALLHCFPGSDARIADLAGTVCIGVLLLKSTNSLIHIGTETITELSEYGRLLLPVMTSAMAAQGGVTASAAMYTISAAFNTLLTRVIAKVLVPMVYIYLALSVANSAAGEEALKKMRDFSKWLMTWSLKILLYVFTGFMSITGVVSGTTDAATLKATKLAISGMVPVVGGILSDASESVLVGAGLVKNAAGVYGILAILAVFLGPFLRIGVHYLLLKTTAALCGVFGGKRTTDLVQDFTGAMGIVLAMTGTVCLLLLISTVCFLKEVG